jgi:16S rRNA (cytosine967-C5)-methyltransferase
MPKPGLAARRAALDLLNGVRIGLQPLSDLQLPKSLPVEEKARAYRLAVDTLRWSGRADRMIGPYLRQRPPEEVLNLLRLGTVELCIDKSAPHGVVDGAVSLAKEDAGTRRQAGLVNAVLRKVSAETGKWDKLPLPQLPKWLRKRLVAAYGKEVAAAIEASHAAGAPLDITPREAPPDEIAKALGGRLLPTGSVRLDSGQVSALPGFDGGKWWVQDAAAAIPARVLAPHPRESVLDMCAAPGGKTMQLAATGADVTALDISAARMDRVTENLARTGLQARTVVADALTWEGGPFDAILLDAPCSATGTIRRHPDLPFVKAESQIDELVSLQTAMLDGALALLRPGGRMVFCTCSLLPEEGEAQVEAALARHPGLAVDHRALHVAGIDPSWVGPHGLRLRPDFWPELGGMDGFFITCLRSSARSEELR